MSSSHNSTKEKGKKVSLRPALLSGAEFDDKPLWNHVKITDLAKKGGGNRKWICNYCDKDFTGSYTKVKAHLLKESGNGVRCCPKVTPNLLKALKGEYEEAETRIERNKLDAMKKSNYISLPPGSDLQQQHKKRKNSNPITESFEVANRDKADKLCARMFYASALPFNLSKSPYFCKYSSFLANNKLPGYIPPTYNRLRTTLLAQEKTHISRKLQPIRDSWNKKGVSICSDGWSDKQRRPIINLMATNVNGAVFIRSIDASGNKKDADYVADLFISAIEEVGPENVVQVVTDNGSNFKAAGQKIEEKYPHIFWTPCVVHCLSLAMKSMCDPPERSTQYAECKWIADLVEDVQNVRNFMVNHETAMSIFRRFSKLGFLRVADTRFASHIVMIKRLSELRQELESTVIDASWRVNFKADGKSSIDIKAQQVRKYILDDTWWSKIDYFVKFTEPIMDMLRAADTDAPVLHLIYDMWDSMIEKVKVMIFAHEEKDLLTDQSPFFDAIYHILEARWTKSNTPLHCMAHALVPIYYSKEWLQDGISKRQAPHEDREVSINRGKCFKKLFSEPSALKQVNREYGLFCSSSGYFSEPHVLEAMCEEEPIVWWANHGASTPLLQSLAFKLLSQQASSSCCERNFSTFSLIESIKRNRLATTRAEDLVFIHSNIRLLSRKKKSYTKGPARFWDIGADKVDTDLDDDLSIGEPEYDFVQFIDVLDDVDVDAQEPEAQVMELD